MISLFIILRMVRGSKNNFQFHSDYGNELTLLLVSSLIDVI